MIRIHITNQESAVCEYRLKHWNYCHPIANHCTSSF